MSNNPDPSAKTNGAATPVPTSARPLSAEDLITLNEEIASMARAGLPLDQGLTMLAREMAAGRLQSVTAQLGNDLRAGCTLPQAMEKQKGRVPPYYAALLSAGIRSGRLGDVLSTLSVYARALSEFRANIVSALVYPAMILLLGIGLSIFVGYTIIPVYAAIFEQFKMKLPLVTQILLFVGKHPLPILVLPPVVISTGLFATWSVLRASPEGRAKWTRFVYALPVIGTLVRSARLAAFTDLLGLLVDQNIPLPEALTLAGEASSDPLLAEGAKHVLEEVHQGVSLGTALYQARLVPALVVWMIGFGEKQGSMGPALHQIAHMYRRHVEVRATLVRTVLPPLLILAVALVLGAVFILGLMAPFLALLDGLSGGKM